MNLNSLGKNIKLLIFLYFIGVKCLISQRNNLLISKNHTIYKGLYGLYSLGYIRDSVNNKKFSVGGYLNFDITDNQSKNKFAGITLISPIKIQYKKLNFYFGPSIDYFIVKYQYNNRKVFNKINSLGIGTYIAIGIPIYKNLSIFTDFNLSYSYRKEVSRNLISGYNKTNNFYEILPNKILSFTLIYKI